MVVQDNIIILYKDEHLVVCQKPSGLVCEEAGKDSLPFLLAKQLSEGDGQKEFKLYPVHRLDKETAGIVVYALTPTAASKLSEQIACGRWNKIYRALVCGELTDDSGTFCDLLFYDRKRSRSYVVDRERKGVKDAKLEYKVISREAASGCTEVEIKLYTGRTHQIRVQFASRKLPLCGDRRYGAPAELGNKLALCAVSLELFHPITDEALHFEISPYWENRF